MPQDYDSAYKAFYERLFQKWNVPVETEVEVSRRAKSIDAVIRCEEEHLQRLKDTAFCFFRSINSLELKSPEDPLNLPGYMTVGVSIDLETLIEGVRRMSEAYRELTPGLKRALERWFEDYPQHIHEIAPIRRVLEERERNTSMNAILRAKQEDLNRLLRRRRWKSFGKVGRTFGNLT